MTKERRGTAQQVERQGFPHAEYAISEMLDATDLLVANGHHRPALILLYSTIDAIASLARPAASQNVTRQYFVSWAEAYMLTEGAEPACTALELYAARCGLLHTHGPEARLTDEGSARVIAYAWGTATLAELRDVIARMGKQQAVVGIHFDDLIAAVRRGFERFLTDARTDPVRRQLIEQRARMLAPVTRTEAEAFLERGRGGEDTVR